MVSEEVKSAFSNFASSTSCHGVAYIDSWPKRATKLLWAAVVLLMLCLVIFEISQVVNNYINAPPTTSITRQRIDILPMPDILVCNKAALDLARMRAEGISLRTANFLLQFPFPVYFDLDQIGVNQFALNVDNETLVQIDKEVISFLASNNFTDLYQLYEHFRLRPETFINSISNGVIGTRNMSAFYADTRLVHHYLYGVCYVIENNADVFWPGMYDGATIYLTSSHNLSARAYSTPGGPFASYEGGFALELDRPLWHDSQDFIQIPYNVMADVRIELENTTYDVHTRPWPRNGDRFCEDSDRALTPNECYLYRYAMTTQFGFGCIPYPYNTYLRDTNATTCTPLSYVKSASAVRDLVNIECLPACNRLSFRTSVTYGSFDTLRFLRDRRVTETMDVSVIRVSYANMVVTTIEYSQSVTIDTLVSNIGGQLGLFLGASIITIIHAFTLPVHLAHIAFKSRKKARTANNDSE